MSIREFTVWLSETGLSLLIQTTSWAIPAIQTLHILALAALFASALVLALRFAGRGIVSEPLSRIAARFTKGIWLLLLVLLVTGSLLILAEPGRTLTNPVFFAKMSMLALVIIITLWLASVARRASVQPSAVHVLAAIFTMLLWSGIIVAGRFIAYVESF